MNLGSQRCCVNSVIKGSTGPQGPIGSYGPIGEIGVSGTTGSTGPIGATGLCYRGRRGPQGQLGEQGGLTGNAGPIGPTGSFGTELSINRHFTFTTSLGASYNNINYTDLTSLSSVHVINNVILTNGSYSISWEISEGWSDLENNFYIRLIHTSSLNIYHPEVFNHTSPCVLYSDINQITGIGNDVIMTIPSGNYNIELMQSTNSTSSISISLKTIRFSITFVKL
jgi:hypothetical protein